MGLREAQDAITGVITGNLGAERVVDIDAVHGVESPRNRRVRALLAPTVDVSINSGERHPASPLGIGTYDITTHRVVIAVDHALTVEIIDDAAIVGIRADVAEAMDEIVAALSYRGNLSVDCASAATGVISGMMVGDGGARAPTWRIEAEDWSARVVRSVIEGRIILQNTREVAA